MFPFLYGKNVYVVETILPFYCLNKTSVVIKNCANNIHVNIDFSDNRYTIFWKTVQIRQMFILKYRSNNINVIFENHSNEINVVVKMVQARERIKIHNF
jgi:hypothetical protein